MYIWLSFIKRFMIRFLLGISIFLQVSCSPPGKADSETNYGNSNTRSSFLILNDTLINLTELKRGDILVKPNHNWLPGTYWVYGGCCFGHAAIVLEGSTGKDAIEVLSKAKIFESHALDVPPLFEVRINLAYNPTPDSRYVNQTFARVREGYRYRLRPGLTEQQFDLLFEFITAQENGLSSWRALKNFSRGNELLNPGYQAYFYCSHLIWQAFYSVLGIDLDVNRGIYVYPNDLIGSPFFENDQNYREKRVRF